MLILHLHGDDGDHVHSSHDHDDAHALRGHGRDDDHAPHDRDGDHDTLRHVHDDVIIQGNPVLLPLTLLRSHFPLPLLQESVLR